MSDLRMTYIALECLCSSLKNMLEFLNFKLPLLYSCQGDAGKDGRQEEKGMTEDEMVGWCHPLNGHKFE